MSKIAIVVCGQTRNHNEYASRWLEGLNILLEGYEYHLYGHTWTDCEDSMIHNNFHNYVKTDSSEIWDNFVKENIFSRIPYREDWQNHQDFNRVMDNQDNFLEFCKRKGISTYAQTWSFIKALNTVPIKNYDIVMKHRWDFTLCDTERNSHSFEYFKEIMKSFFDQTGEFETGYSDSEVLVCGPSSASRGSIQDGTFFIKTGNRFLSNIADNSPQYSLKLATKNVDIDRRSHSHELWYDLIVKSGGNITVGLPNGVFQNESMDKGFFKEEF